MRKIIFLITFAAALAVLVSCSRPQAETEAPPAVETAAEVQPTQAAPEPTQAPEAEIIEETAPVHEEDNFIDEGEAFIEDGIIEEEIVEEEIIEAENVFIERPMTEQLLVFRGYIAEHHSTFTEGKAFFYPNRTGVAADFDVYLNNGDGLLILDVDEPLANYSDYNAKGIIRNASYLIFDSNGELKEEGFIPTPNISPLLDPHPYPDAVPLTQFYFENIGEGDVIFISIGNTHGYREGNKMGKTYAGWEAAAARLRVVSAPDVSPSIIIQPKSASVARTQYASLSVAANNFGGGELSYQWYKNGSPLPGETHRVVVVPTEAEGEDEYFCRVVNSVLGFEGTTESKPAKITVNQINQVLFNTAADFETRELKLSPAEGRLAATDKRVAGFDPARGVFMVELVIEAGLDGCADAIITDKIADGFTLLIDSVEASQGGYKINPDFRTIIWDAGGVTETAALTYELKLFSASGSGEYPLGEAFVTYTGNSDYNVFENPFGKADDPWVVKAGKKYFLCWSAGDGILILEAETLVDIFDGEARLVWSYSDEGFVGGVWAPELHYLFGRWYLYAACNDHPRFMYVIEGGANPDDPLDGEYKFVGQMKDGLEDFIVEYDYPLGGIDATVFEYDGEWYYVASTFSTFWESGQELRIARMENAYTLSTDAVTLTLPIYHYEAYKAWRWEHWINEGPVALQNGEGGLFMIYSAGASWDNYYCLAILELRGPDLLNPLHWDKYHDPSFERTETVFGPGHNSFVKSPDGTEDWIVYHSARAFGSAWDRVGNMQAFSFDGNGRPVFGEPVERETKTKVPSGTPFSVEREVVRGELHRTTVFFPKPVVCVDESNSVTIKD